MTKLYSRRSFLKGLFSISFASLLTACGGYIYARHIEPALLDIVDKTIVHKKIPNSFNGVKIVQFSDTHLSDYFTLERLDTIVTKINQLSPDILLFTGDLMDEPNQYHEVNKVAPILQKLHARLGKFAVYGNHDHGGYGTDIYKDVITNAGFTLLQNSVKNIVINQDKIAIAGLDDLMLGKPNYQSTLGTLNEDQFNVLLAHEPDAALESNYFHVDLQLSGHSHAGQIQLPFYGPLITPPYASVYHEGMYEIGQMRLYVNRGLGTTRLPFRFLSTPEITTFTLSNKEIL
ncbi:metallophosphoesterase [Metabacillus malikii]|uniref:MPP superfamily phosphohydrolase n=1 Tax=Metabacillus malikii TaxID=1504265 RepID=A0ABT9ZB97_9BACI|nr:metallophosphoesterase [Metabacillus malikii]MDQ0229529.1 putative MPP superfamily phosphohydrolase [Metabacillus malikii]